MLTGSVKRSTSPFDDAFVSQDAVDNGLRHFASIAGVENFSSLFRVRHKATLDQDGGHFCVAEHSEAGARFFRLEA